MNTLPPIAGLLHLAAHKRKQAQWNRTKAGNPPTDARLAHECETAATQLEKEADEHEQHASSNADLIMNIETLLHYFNHSPFDSELRTLAKRHLEDASMRLRREIGYPPES